MRRHVAHYYWHCKDFAGLTLVVRFEVDACYPSANASSRGAADALADALSSLSVSGSTANAGGRTAFGVTVIEAGSEVAQSALIELKTRSARNVESFDWADAYPQLYLGQTPTSIIGVHRSGTFFEKREKKMNSPQLKDVARVAQRNLKQIGQLLREIRGLVKERGGERKFSLLCRSGVLQLVERTSADSLLPVEVLERFAV